MGYLSAQGGAGQWGDGTSEPKERTEDVTRVMSTTMYLPNTFPQNFQVIVKRYSLYSQLLFFILSLSLFFAKVNRGIL